MDDNSIIITLQFLYDCIRRDKTESYEYQTYDLDIIVPKNMTCDELMDAIKAGLQKRFEQVKSRDEKKARDNNDEDKIKEIVGVTPEKVHQCNPPLKESVKRKGKDSRWGFVLSDSADDEKEIDYADCWETHLLAICINIFETCYKKYCGVPVENTTDENPDTVSVSALSPYKIKSIDTLAEISVASVNPLVYREDAVLAKAHNDQIWLRRNSDAESLIKCDTDEDKKKIHGKKIGDIQLHQIGFMSGTRVIFDVYNVHGGRFLFQGEIIPAFANDVPEYNISDRPLFELDTEPVNVIPPTDPPQKSKQNFLAMMLSPLLMMGSMLVVRLFASSGTGLDNQSTLIMSISMVGATVLLGLINWIFQKKTYRDSLNEWRKQYQDYIRNLTLDIVARQESDIEKLNQLYPPVYYSDYNDISKGGLVAKALALDGDIFGRSRKHPSFLCVRIGTANKNSRLIPSVFEIVGEKKDVLFSVARYKNLDDPREKPFFSIVLDEDAKKTDGALVDLPSAISGTYSYLGDSKSTTLPPVMVDIKSSGTLGIVSSLQKNNSTDYLQALIDNIIFDLCFHHNPGDLQFCVFFNEVDGWDEQQRLINKYRHLPHFRELLGGFSPIAYKDGDDFNELSQFVFNKSDANKVFDRVHEIATQRKSDESIDRFPQIIMIFIDDYQLKSHQLSEYLYDYIGDDEVREDYGLSFVFCAEYFEKLPKYCGQIIEIKNKSSDGKCSMRLLPHVRMLENKRHLIKENVKYDYSSEENSEQYWLESDVLFPIEKNKSQKDGKTTRDDYYRAYKTLSALYYFRIAQGAGVPSLVELSTLHQQYEDELKTQLAEFIRIFNVLDQIEKTLKGQNAKALDVNYTEFKNSLISIIKTCTYSGGSLQKKQTIEKKINSRIEKCNGKLVEYNDLLVTLQTAEPQQKNELQGKKNVIASDILEKCQELVALYSELFRLGKYSISIERKNSDVTKSLSVPIGYKSEDEEVCLDLHEKHDGPHMLVAGTTGSGKSEAILTYLMGLCICFSPDEVNILLVDMKGGDFIRRLGKLPHVVGTVSDIDSVSTDDETDSDNTEYMLARFLRSMKAEIRRRKKLFKELNAKDIDEYIQKQRKDPNAMKLSHLVLVVDEFTELMQFSEENPSIDFKKEISSLARIGRSLGFHIILISQNIEGAITDNIRVNSRARLCFKVATKEASKEMIGSEAAADPLMPGFGRGFLYVGNGARSDYFQAAYSGASALTNSKPRILIPIVERSGRYSVFYNSYIDNENAKKAKAHSDAVGTQIDWFASFVGNLEYDTPHQMLKPLLETTLIKGGEK